MKVCPQCGARSVAADWRCKNCGRQPVHRGCLVYFAPETGGGDGGDASSLLLVARRQENR